MEEEKRKRGERESVALNQEAREGEIETKSYLGFLFKKKRRIKKTEEKMVTALVCFYYSSFP